MLSKKVLVLNRNYIPLTVCTVKRAIILMFLGKAELVESRNGNVIRSASEAFAVPSVVRLSFFVRQPPYRVSLTRKNILKRDNFTCQYCGSTDKTMTTDHVIPKKQGGNNSWSNLVCACQDCNNKKGDKTPEEAGMPLLRKPKEPSNLMMLQFLNRGEKEWKQYLFIK
jgi:5-methylcytosine-specific restriction endonuclease McrA